MAPFKQLTKRLGGERASMGDTATLIRRYVIQETLEPIKQLGKAVGYGLAGGITVGLGGVFLLIGALRVLQTETGSAFSGKWSFAPYFIVVVLCGLAIGGLIARGFRANAYDEELER